MSGRGLTPPSSGRPPACFACLRSPLMSNVRPLIDPAEYAFHPFNFVASEGLPMKHWHGVLTLFLFIPSLGIAQSNPTPMTVEEHFSIAAGNTEVGKNDSGGEF